MAPSFVEAIVYRLPEYLSVFAAISTTLVAVLGAFRSGAVKRIRVGNIELEGGDREALERIRTELAVAKAGAPIPFEIEQLASYYSVTLGQAKVSFWFSLVFASVGFIVIIGAAFLYSNGDLAGASVKILSGIIIDAVAALFFVQSRRAQDAMGAFFEKLRTDRQYIEGRKICEELTDEKTKNNLKAILVLHYSGLQSAGMLDLLAGAQPKPIEPITQIPASASAKPKKAAVSKSSTQPSAQPDSLQNL